jgi:hypothetical protein
MCSWYINKYFLYLILQYKKVTKYKSLFKLYTDNVVDGGGGDTDITNFLGPTVLFDRNGTRYFSCSAFRSRKLCPYFLPEEQWTIIDDDADVGTKRKAQNKKRHASFDTNDDDEDSKEGIRRRYR